MIDRLFREAVECADSICHAVGYCPRWLCDLHDRHITGERE